VRARVRIPTASDAGVCTSVPNVSRTRNPACLFVLGGRAFSKSATWELRSIVQSAGCVEATIWETQEGGCADAALHAVVQRRRDGLVRVGSVLVGFSLFEMSVVSARLSGGGVSATTSAAHNNGQRCDE